jgi:hypothetical protein
MAVRKSDLFFGCLGIGIVFFCVLLGHASYAYRECVGLFKEHAEIVRKYGLTDLCLFTDARYTRNPAVADLASAFQDHPVSLEHFPSGSIIGPPMRGIRGLD